MKMQKMVWMGALALGAANAQAAGVTLTMSCGSVGQDHEYCKKIAAEWGAKTGNTLELLNIPQSSSDTLGLFRQMFSAKSDKLDVMQIDVVWPGILKDQLLDLKPYSQGVEKNFFPAMVVNNTVNGKLLALPWVTDAGVLFYRKDLLAKYGEKPPTTWAELTATAKKVMEAERKAGNAAMQGFVFQAKAYEGLSCSGLEWVASMGGGSIIDSAGKTTINNPQAAKALDMAASWIGTIAPTGVLNYAEEEARGVFQNGNAVFMRNWPYAWALGNGADSGIKGKIGVATMPRGEGAGSTSASTLGGWQMAVSKYSKHPKEAADLVLYMTSQPVQKERSITLLSNPTIPALYQDKDILAANPFYGDLFETLKVAIPRPATATGVKYNEVSAAFWNATHEVLSGKATGAESVKKLEGKIDGIRRGPSW
ncbi:ABC transporter substrate-binding protein [Rhodoferax sp.]|uniref:ABC transporter substrate-binding protein n=1 Tax=Rhodoferax sp. TaxID=50421 RepID=UPI0025F568C3|nr:ABC transporter substrate-binding protein [Rhodoferax sp.]